TPRSRRSEIAVADTVGLEQTAERFADAAQVAAHRRSRSNLTRSLLIYVEHTLLNSAETAKRLQPRLDGALDGCDIRLGDVQRRPGGAPLLDHLRIRFARGLCL